MKYVLIVVCWLVVNVGFAQQDNQAPFFDDFKDNRFRWYEFNEPEASGKIENGSYVFAHHRTAGSWSLWNTIRVNPDKNFTIEAKIRFLGGFDKHGYGLIWGAADLENKYFFIVTSQGYYAIRRVKGGKIKDIKRWTPNIYVNQGSKENTLTIKKTGKSLLFYANQELLFASNFQPLFGDKIGFTLARRMKISVDYLKVTQDN